MARNAKGAGTIRKKTVTRNGKPYTYWEARVTTGRDPGTGKQLQRSFTGKTQAEVRRKLQAAAVAVDNGTYTDPSRLTVGQWLDIWQRDYLGGVKPSTAGIYRANIRNHITPRLGAVRLTDLRPHAVQSFINGLDGLSPASVKLVYRILHHGLERAVELHYIANNPAFKCVLPKAERKEPQPLDDSQVSALLEAVRGGELEHLVAVALFTGLRLSELLGLTWDAVDFTGGTISVNKQLAQSAHRRFGLFQSPKSGKARTIAPAPAVFAALRRQRARQAEQQLKAGAAWHSPEGLVFTVDSGGPLNQSIVDRRFQAALLSAGLSGFHFHSLRHTYAVNAIRAGDDIKTIQGNLGHATAAFTLDQYGHYTEQMQRSSAARMEAFIKGVLEL